LLLSDKNLLVNPISEPYLILIESLELRKELSSFPGLR
jgi:hypothetical protein